MSHRKSLLDLYELDQKRRGLSAETILSRHRVLVSFERVHLCGFAGVDAEMIQLWLDGKRVSAKTRYTQLSHLHAFYEWAVGAGELDHDPTAGIARPRLRRSLPRPIEDHALQRALDIATPELRAMILLGAYQGLRCQEIAGLSREDVLDADNLLRVTHAKGGHERLIPLHPEVYRALQALPLPRAGFVFRGPRGDRYTPARVSHKLREHFVGLEIQSTAHALRHWFGSHLYAGTHDLRLTQEMLGHQSPSTTAIYTAFDHRAAATAVQALKVPAAGSRPRR